MKKRLILLFILLALAALVGGASAIYYAISARQLAKRQAAFRARGVEALQRVAGLLQKNRNGADSTGLTPPRYAPRDAALPTSATRPSGPGQSVIRPRRIAARPATPRRGLDQLLLDASQHSQDLARLPSLWPVWTTIELKSDDLDARGALTVTGRQKLLDKVRKRLAELESLNSRDNSKKAFRERLDELERKLPDTPIAEDLSRMEDALLAADWTLPDYNDYFQAVSASSYPLHPLSDLAILRTALRGDDARAGRLLLKDLEYLCGRYLAAYPKGNEFLANQLNQTLFTLCELVPLPGDTLDRAARLLASVQPTAQQASDLHQAHALRWVNNLTADEDGRSGQSAMTFFNQNFFHFIQINDIGFDTILFRLNRPKMNQFFHDYAAAWVDGRRDAMKSAERHLAALARVCNQDPDALRFSLQQIDDAGDYLSQSSLALARLVLAAMRYRRDTGQFPASDAELGPRYLDPPLEATSTTWHLLRLGAFESRLAGGAAISFPAHPVFYSRRLWRRFESGDYQFDRPPDWELSREDRARLQPGFKERLVLCLNVVIPRFPDAWRAELDLIKRIGAPADPAAPLATADSVKNPSNQTSATALKK